jgi:hypothetical protein
MFGEFADDLLSGWKLMSQILLPAFRRPLETPRAIISFVDQHFSSSDNHEN